MSAINEVAALLRFLRDNEGAVEADLQRFYNIDYCDRWRGRLSLRKIRVLIENLPPESVLGGGWSREAHLLDDLRIAQTSTKKKPAKPHPQRPKPRKRSVNPKRIAEGQRRRRERLRQIEAGEIT